MNEELTLFKVKQKIFWADYYSEAHKFKKFNYRKHGVTIDDDFLKILAHNQYLTTQHLAFFQSMFKYYYGQSKVLSLDCHIFAEFIPHLTQGITNSMIVSPVIQQTENLQMNQFNFNENYFLNEEQSTENPSMMENIYSKLVRTIQFLNPKRVWNYMFGSKTNEVQHQELIDQTTQSVKLNILQNQNQDQEVLKKFGFQIKNIEYVQRDPNERSKIINKGEIKINSIVIQENEKGKYKYKQLNAQFNNIIGELKLKENLNIFSQFKNTFIPINLSNNHWIAAIIFYEEKYIQYLDSYASSPPEDVVQGIIQMANYKGEGQKWKMITECPQQENRSFDCGVFCLMALYQLYKTGQPISRNSYTQNDITSFRQQLLHLAIIESQHDLNQKLVHIILDYKHKN